MKFRITLKDPDGVSDAITEAVESLRPPGLSDDEWEDIKDERERKLVYSRFIGYGEYVTIEIDTEKDTAVVVPFK